MSKHGSGKKKANEMRFPNETGNAIYREGFFENCNFGDSRGSAGGLHKHSSNHESTRRRYDSDECQRRGPYQNQHRGDYEYMDTDQPNDRGHDCGSSASRRMQSQQQQFRSLQASKQMLYDVYEQNMGMIEELETRDSRNTAGPQQDGGMWPFSRSKISLPSQQHKARTDVTAIIEAELVCLQTQLLVAPNEVVRSVIEELIKKTLLWLAHRHEMGAPLARCDKYAINVLEVLLRGEANVEPREKGPDAGRLDEDIVNSVMGGFQGAKHNQKLQDDEYRRDDKKDAKLCDIRGGRTLLEGVQRVLGLKPDLEPYLSKYVDTEDIK